MWHCAGVSNFLALLHFLVCVWSNSALECAMIMLLVHIWMIILASVQQTITCLIAWPKTALAEAFDFLNNQHK